MKVGRVRWFELAFEGDTFVGIIDVWSGVGGEIMW